MNREEHLLSILAEECAEVAQRATKALRFGMSEVEPGQASTNRERIYFEMCDLVAAYEMLCAETLVNLDHAPLGSLDARAKIKNKQRKVESYLEYSADCGTLTRNTNE